MGGRGLEPPTPSLSNNRNSNASGNQQGLTSTPSAACTAACTSKDENANSGTPNANRGTEGEGRGQGDSLAKLAASLLALSPADRARLAAMLNGEQYER